MRYFGHTNVPAFPVAPDSIATFILAANVGQSMAFPANADLARVTFSSTSGVGLAGVVNWASTAAAWGSSAAATAGSSLQNNMVPGGSDRMWQIPRGLTAGTSFSVACGAASLCCVEFWSRIGTTA